MKDRFAKAWPITVLGQRERRAKTFRRRELDEDLEFIPVNVNKTEKTPYLLEGGERRSNSCVKAKRAVS